MANRWIMDRVKLIVEISIHLNRLLRNYRVGGERKALSADMP